MCWELGWGTWIRTRTNRVRVCGSTVNLFPSGPPDLRQQRERIKAELSDFGVSREAVRPPSAAAPGRAATSCYERRAASVLRLQAQARSFAEKKARKRGQNRAVRGQAGECQVFCVSGGPPGSVVTLSAHRRGEAILGKRVADHLLPLVI